MHCYIYLITITYNIRLLYYTLLYTAHIIGIEYRTSKAGGDVWKRGMYAKVYFIYLT